MWFKKNKYKSRYRGRTLSAETINAQRQTNDHKRAERKKNADSIVTYIATVGSVVLIPILYLILITANWESVDRVTTYLWSGITGLGGFIAGKARSSKKD